MSEVVASVIDCFSQEILLPELEIRVSVLRKFYNLTERPSYHIFFLSLLLTF